MRSNRRLLPTAAALLLMTAALVAQQATPVAQPETPVFRAGVDLIRVDVSVMGRNNQPVPDLQATDFEVLEDDLPQAVQTVQFVRLDGTRQADTGEGLDIRSAAHAEVEAAKDDVRLFGIFLDDYHIDKHPTLTIPLRRALEGFIEQLGPSDMVALMEPLTTLYDLRFTRSKQALLERVRTFEGRRGEVFPVRSAVEEAQLTQRNWMELRAGVTLSALEALVTRLGGIREGRKSVLFVSQGPPVGTPSNPNYPRLEAVLQAANRGNVTIHVLDPRPLGSAPFGGSDSLNRLYNETGGRALINTNNPAAGLTQIIEDASAYYLLGYSPARERSDGKFHRIQVRVKRSGARVLARRGYWAPTAIEANPAPAAAADPGLTAALSVFSASERGRLAEVWIGTAPAGDGQVEVAVTWEPADRPGADAPVSLEVEPVTRGPEVTAVAAAQTVAAAPRPGVAGVAARFVLPPGALGLRFTARGADTAVVDRWTQAITIPDYAAVPLALSTPRVFRSRSVIEARALAADVQPTPMASRQFRRTDRLRIDMDYRATGDVTVTAQLLNRDGKILASVAVPPRTTEGRISIPLPLASLAPSVYVLRLDVAAGDERASQHVAFTVGT